MSIDEEPSPLTKIRLPPRSLLVSSSPYIFLLLLAVVEWRLLISAEHIIGVHWDWGLPFYKYQMYNTGSSDLSAYSYLLGGLKPQAFNLYFDFLFFGLFSHIPVPVAVYEDALLVGFSFLSGASTFLLVSRIKQRCLYIDLVASIIYMFSPFIFFEMVEGHYGFLISYSLLPLILYFTWKMRDAPRIISYELLFLVALLDLFQTEPYFLFFYPAIVLILAIDRLFAGRSKNILRFTTKLLITVGLFAVTDLYLIYTEILTVLGPPFYGQLTQQYPLWVGHPALSYFSLEYIGNSSFSTAISSFQPLWLLTATFLLSIAILSLMISRLARFRPLSLTLILGYGLPLLFLIPWISNSVFPNTPLLVFFHNTGDFLILAILGESVLLSLTLGHFYGLTKGLRKILLMVLILVLVTVYVSPFLSGNFSGNVSTYVVPSSYLAAETLLQSDHNYSNAWLPLFPAQNSNSYLTGGTAYNPMQIYSDDTFDWWQQPLPYYLESLMASGDAKTASPLLGLFSVKHIAAPTALWVPQLSTLNTENVYNYAALLSKESGYSPIYRSADVQVFDNNAALPRVFGQSAVLTFAGNFAELGLFENNITTLSGHPLMTSFPYNLDSKQTLGLLNDSEWIIGGQNYTDYFMSQILPHEYTYLPAIDGKLTGNWLNIRSIPYLPPSLVSSPYPPEISLRPSSIEIPTSITSGHSGTYTLMLYLYEGPMGSSLDVQIGAQDYEITTLNPIPTWTWLTISLPSFNGGSIKILTSDGTNAVADMILVPDDVLQSYSRDLSAILSSKSLIELSNPSSSAVQLQKLISDVKLETNLGLRCNADDSCVVNVPNTVRAVFYTFSRGPYWIMESQNGSLEEVNGVGTINGWTIPLNSQNSETFRISLSVQGGYLYAVVISVCSALCLPIFSIIVYYRGKRTRRERSCVLTLSDFDRRKDGRKTMYQTFKV